MFATISIPKTIMQFVHVLFSFILPHLLQPLKAVNAVSPEELASAYRSDYSQSDRRLFLFDNDGVLKPVHGSASAAEARSARSILERLSADPNNEVWVISARSLENVERQYSNIPRLNLAGELGATSRRYGEEATSNYEDLAEPTRLLANPLRLLTSTGLIVRSSGSIIFQHEGKTDYNTLRVLTEMESLASGAFEYVKYPQFAALTHNACNKGRLASTLLDRYSGNHFVMSLGDTQVDVPMFEALEQHSNPSRGAKTLSVRVGSADISADASLRSHHDVYKFFNALL